MGASQPQTRDGCPFASIMVSTEQISLDVLIGREYYKIFGLNMGWIYFNLKMCPSILTLEVRCCWDGWALDLFPQSWSAGDQGEYYALSAVAVFNQHFHPPIKGIAGP